jgi:hypothetical protein
VFGSREEDSWDGGLILGNGMSSIGSVANRCALPSWPDQRSANLLRDAEQESKDHCLSGWINSRDSEDLTLSDHLHSFDAVG